MKISLTPVPPQKKKYIIIDKVNAMSIEMH